MSLEVTEAFLENRKEDVRKGIPIGVNTIIRIIDSALAARAELAECKAAWFEKGRKAVLRRNESGCCCELNEAGDAVVSACDVHQAWIAAAKDGK